MFARQVFHRLAGVLVPNSNNERELAVNSGLAWPVSMGVNVFFTVACALRNLQDIHQSSTSAEWMLRIVFYRFKMYVSGLEITGDHRLGETWTNGPWENKKVKKARLWTTEINQRHVSSLPWQDDHFPSNNHWQQL